MPRLKPNPDEVLHLRHSRGWSLAVLLGLLVHTWFKWRLGTLPELLWGCNIASLVILAGLWVRDARLVGTGFLWHLCVGEPGWLWGVILTGHTLWISVVMHTLPTLAAFLYLRRTGLPRSTPFLAFLLFVALVPLSHYLTPPDLNINFAHHRLDFLVARFPGNWDYRLAFSAGMLAFLLAGDWGMAKLLGRPRAEAA